MAALGWVDAGKSIYAAPRMAWLSYLVGGLMFGFGMVLASGCGSKTLVRIGGGNLKSVVVLAIADDVHIVQHFDHVQRESGSAEQAFVSSISHLFAPLLGASVTTALGLASLAIRRVPQHQHPADDLPLPVAHG